MRRAFIAAALGLFGAFGSPAAAKGPDQERWSEHTLWLPKDKSHLRPDIEHGADVVAADARCRKATDGAYSKEKSQKYGRDVFYITCEISGPRRYANFFVDAGGLILETTLDR